MTTSQQGRPSTPEEDIKVLYGRVAKLSDSVSALLAPAWGSETGIIPTDHPLYVGEEPVCDAYQPPTKPEDSGLCARCGMSDYKHHAAGEDLERNNRALAKCAERAGVRRDQLAATLREVLAAFSHATVFGRTGFYLAESPIAPHDFDRWRAVLDQPKLAPPPRACRFARDGGWPCPASDPCATCDQPKEQP